MNNARRKKLEMKRQHIKILDEHATIRSCDKYELVGGIKGFVLNLWSNGWHWITQPMGEDKRR